MRDMLGRLGQSHFAVLPGDRRQRRGRAAGSERDAGLRRAAGRHATCSSPRSTPSGSGAAAGVRTGWKLRSIDGAPIIDAARRRCPTRSSRGCCRSKRGGSRTCACAARRARAPRSSFEDGIGRGRAAVRRAPARSRRAGDRRQSADDVRAGRSHARRDAARPAGGRDWLQRLDDGRRSAVPEGGRRVPRKRRHRHRSARESRRARRDADGHLGPLHRRAQGARGDEDARQRAALRRQSAARERARASACSPSPGRSRSSSMR